MKEQLIEVIKHQINERMETAWNAMQAAQASANEESKSSAGDKYETARAMGQLDRDMFARQFEQARHEMLSLQRIQTGVEATAVIIGSLVDTTMGLFFIAVSLGSLTVEGKKIMVVSPQSPIGQLLMGKKIGESFNFRGQACTIKSLG